MKNYKITIAGKGKIRIDFIEDKTVLFFEGTETEFLAELKTSKLIKSKVFTKLGLEYVNFAKVGKVEFEYTTIDDLIATLD